MTTRLRINSNIIITISLLVALAGFGTWVMMLSGTDAARVWRAFLINFLFFTSAAAGLVTIPAMVVATYGNWMGNLEKYAWTGLSFSVPSVIALVVLWIGSNSWAPWLDNEHAYHKIWLDNTFLFLRNTLLLTLFWIMAFVFIRNRQKKGFRKWAYWLCLTFAITFSVMGFDFVMALEPEWYSMMTGGYFFVSSLYMAIALWIILSLLFSQPEKKKLHDMGKLLIAFCMITTYLMFSHLLPIWYENIPHETLFLVPRMNLAWKGISLLLLGVVYLGPIFLLLPAYTKRKPILIGGIATMIFLGMWVERWWLVSAVFEWNKVTFGWAEIIPFLAFLGISMAGIITGLNFVSEKYMPKDYSSTEKVHSNKKIYTREKQ